MSANNNNKQRKEDINLRMSGMRGVRERVHGKDLREEKEWEK